jgi:hypothetical protein
MRPLTEDSSGTTYDPTRQAFTCPDCHKTFPVSQCVLIEEGHTRFWSVRPHADPGGLIPYDDSYSTTGDDDYLLECPDCRATAHVDQAFLRWDSDQAQEYTKDDESVEQTASRSTPDPAPAAPHATNDTLRRIVDIMYADGPNSQWEADTIERVAEVLADAGVVPPFIDDATAAQPRMKRLPTVLELTEREPHTHQAGPVLQAILGRMYSRHESGDTAPVTGCPVWLLDLLNAAELSYFHWPSTCSGYTAPSEATSTHPERCSTRERSKLTWSYSRELQRRATREGWDLYENDTYGTRIEATDSPNEDGPAPLANDNIAIALARAAGVPCLDDGTFPDDVTIIWE